MPVSSSTLGSTGFSAGTRGERCPYRHEMPKNPDGPLAKQTMKDRYYGNNDPVAAKMLSRFGGVYGEGIAAAKRH